jgi:hypothetical protein
MIRCFKCRGQKEYAGIGGIVKKCEACDGKGTVEKIVLKAVGDIKNPEIVDIKVSDNDKPEVKTKRKAKKPEVETVSLAEVLQEAGVPEAVTQEMFPEDKWVHTSGLAVEMAASNAIDNQGKQTMSGPIFSGYDDEFMRAILAEPSMTTEEWRAKYGLIAGGMDIRQRHEIRVMYAASKPIAPRSVDLKAAQDMTVAGDPEYKNYVQQEKMRTERLEAANAKKGMKVEGR